MQNENKDELKNKTVNDLKDVWETAQEWERKDWGDCFDTKNEIFKQYVYAPLMGLHRGSDNVHFDLKDKSIVDIGGGPDSMLRRTIARKTTVVEPCNYPDWIWTRYADEGIKVYRESAETVQLPDRPYDEGWLYNVLQHVKDPQALIRNMLRQVKLLRVCEWVYIPKDPGHLHTLTAQNLDSWFGVKGHMEFVSTRPAVGNLWSAVVTGVVS